MRKSVLITGGSGILALNWAITMRDHQQIFLGLHKRNISIRNTYLPKISIESVEQFTSSLELIKPDFVVHTAGLTNIEMCESNPSLAHDVNVKLSGKVARACANVKIPMVHISTDHLFSGEDSLADETCIPSPKNIYGVTKAEGEANVLENCPNALVIRTNFFGWGPSYRKSFSDFIIDALRKKKEITLFVDAIFTPILTEILVKVVNELVEKNTSGIYNVVGDDRLSKFDFGCKIAECFGLESGLIKIGYLNNNSRFVKRPLDMSLSNKKVSDFLGIRMNGVDNYIKRLKEQENLGIPKELQNI